MMSGYTRERVYELLSCVPRGSVCTYASLASAMGNRNLARAVGNALHANTDPDKYPCYRVVNSRGMLSSSYAFGGIEEQKRRLISDGIEVNGYTVDLCKYMWNAEDRSDG